MFLIFHPQTRNDLFSLGDTASARCQEVYAASNFAGIAAQLKISAVSFVLPTPPFAGSVTNVQINLSTTAKAVDGLSSTFSQNLGPDDVAVLLSGRADTPGPLIFNFSKPFTYNPSAGNLLVDMRIFNSGDWIGPSGDLSVSAARLPGDSVSFVISSSIGPSGVNSPTGLTDTGGLITQFTYTSVPEPSTWAVAALGAVLIFFGRYRQIQTKAKNGKGKETWR